MRVPEDAREEKLGVVPDERFAVESSSRVVEIHVPPGVETGKILRADIVDDRSGFVFRIPLEKFPVVPARMIGVVSARMFFHAQCLPFHRAARVADDAVAVNTREMC